MTEVSLVGVRCPGDRRVTFAVAEEIQPRVGDRVIIIDGDRSAEGIVVVGSGQILEFSGPAPSARVVTDEVGNGEGAKALSGEAAGLLRSLDLPNDFDV